MIKANPIGCIGIVVTPVLGKVSSETLGAFPTGGQYSILPQANCTPDSSIISALKSFAF